MQDSIEFPIKREFSVNVENLNFKLIIDRLTSSNSDKTILSNTFHIHSHIELFVCSRGAISINTPDGIVEIFEGDLAVIPPNYPHTRIIKDDENGIEWCSINFLYVKKHIRESKDLFTLFDNFFAAKSAIVIRDKKDFCQEIKTVVDTVPLYDSVVPAIRVVSAICEMLCKDTFRCSLPETNKHLDGYSEDIDIGMLYKLNHIINSCFMNEFTNAKIAEMLYISERQLSRIASKYYGMSIRRAIIERRLTTAEMLLSETNKNVESIGSAIGYNSKAGFYRDFRKKYGITPVEYRKRLSKNNQGEN